VTTGAGGELLALVTAKAEGSPYVVTPTPDGFDLRIQLQDSRWYSFLRAAGRQQVVEHRVSLDEARKQLVVTDVWHDVRWEVGALGHLLPFLEAEVEVKRTYGRVYAFHGSRTIGGGSAPSSLPDDAGGITRRSAVGRKFIREASAELGWTERRNRFEVIGAVGAVVGLVVAAAVVVAFIVVR
jgi:hypothetical protein